MSRTPHFKAQANKENLFIQIAQKKSSQSVSIKRKNTETFRYADEHYEEIINKISILDKENQKLRELLKKSNYLQFQFVDLSHSKIDLDIHSLSEIKNRSFDLNVKCHYNEQQSFDDLRQLSTPRQQGGQNSSQKRNQNYFSSLAGKKVNNFCSLKQVHYQKQRETLLTSYQQDFLQQEQLDYNYPEGDERMKFGSQIYREMLLNIIEKDGKIFKVLDQLIQQEFNQNFKENNDNYNEQKLVLSNVLLLVEKMIDYCDGNHPDNLFIMRTFKNLKIIIHQFEKLFEKMKLYIIPINTMQSSLQERTSEIDRLQKIIDQANQQLIESIQITKELVNENKKLQEQNKVYQDCFSQISQYLLKPENLKKNIEQTISNTIQEIIPLIEQNESFIESKEEKIVGGRLTKQIISIQNSYNKLLMKNNKNKLKFSEYLNTIQNQLTKEQQIDGFNHLTIEEKVQCLCKTIQQLNIL